MQQQSSPHDSTHTQMESHVQIVNLALTSAIKELSMHVRPAASDPDLARDCHATLTRTIEDVSGRLLELRKLCNQFVSLVRLPDEILVIIFDWSLVRSEEYADHLLNLRLTCHRFNAIIVQSASLWGYLHTAAGPSNVKLALARSKAVPLQVNITIPCSLTGAVTACVKLLTPTVSRWQTAIISFNSWLVQSMWDQPAPCLETLTLIGLERDNSPRANIADRCHELGPLFGGVTPELTSLRVDDASFSWTSLKATKLTSLHVQKLFNSSVSELLSALTACPALEHLALWAFSGSVEAEDPPSASVELPSLTSLDLVNLNQAQATQVVLGISAPSLNKFHLEITPREELSLPLMRQVCYLLRTTRTAGFWETTTFIISLRRDSVTGFFVLENEKVGTIAFTIRGWRSAEAAPTVLRAVSEYFQRECTAMRVHREFILDVEAGILEAMGLLRNLSKLWCWIQPFEQVLPLLEFLSSPYSSVTGEPEFPLPNLQEIGFWGASTQEVWRMVEGRYGSESGRDIKRPNPLRQLYLDGPWDTDHLSDIRQILGDGVLRLDKFN